MPDASCYSICDAETGTYFSAEHAYILDTRALSPGELEVLDGDDDDMRTSLFERRGRLVR